MLDYQQHERFGVYYLRPTPLGLQEGVAAPRNRLTSN